MSDRDLVLTLHRIQTCQNDSGFYHPSRYWVVVTMYLIREEVKMASKYTGMHWQPKHALLEKNGKRIDNVELWKNAESTMSIRWQNLSGMRDTTQYNLSDHDSMQADAPLWG